jgi:hypothetical protein
LITKLKGAFSKVGIAKKKVSEDIRPKGCTASNPLPGLHNKKGTFPDGPSQKIYEKLCEKWLVRLTLQILQFIFFVKMKLKILNRPAVHI